MESIKELKEICQKSIEKEDSVTMKYFVRPTSIYITKFCLLLGINASSITIFFTLLTILAGILFMFGIYKYNLIAAILLQLVYILDAVDGEIARYRKTDSINGKYLDCVVHYIAHPFVIFGLSFGVYTYFNNIYLLVAGFIAALFFLLIDVVRISRFEVVFELVRKSIKLGTHFKEQKENKEVTSLKQYNTFAKKIFYYFSLIFNFRGFSYIILVAAIFNLVYIYLFMILFYAIVLPIIVVGRIYYEHKKGLERFLPYLKIKK